MHSNWLKRCLVLLAHTCTGVAAASFIGWLLGRCFTDQFYITQFLWWIPAWGWLILIVVPMFLRSVLILVTGARTPRTRRVGWVFLLCLLVTSAHAAFWEYRLLRTTPESSEGSMRVLVWNPAGGKSPADLLIRGKPDLITIVNPFHDTQWAEVMASLGSEASAVRSGRMVICSRYRITEWGATSLKVTGAKERTFKWTGGQKVSVDEGYAIYCVMRLNDRESFTVWFLDLPSDPGIPRARMMREAGEAIEGFRGPRYRRNAADDRDELIAGGVEGTGFPAADVAMGDFNTPRGSDSLKRVTSGLTHAFDQAGRGTMGSWPRKFPLLAIDHVFVGPRWRATAYAMMDFKTGDHRSQWCELSPKAP